MIVQLTPAQITQHWEEIAPAIDAALPPFAEGNRNAGRLNNILRAMMDGRMQCWSAWGQRDEQPELIAIFATTFDADACSGVKNLQLYSLYGTRALTDEIYAEGMEVLENFGRAKGCHRLVAFTDARPMIERWKASGGEARYTFLTKDL